MGMFDYVKCDYPTPWPEAADFGSEWQTKSPDAVYLETWEIRADGTLWHEDVDYEDRSDPNAEGLLALAGAHTPVNHRWRRVDDWNGEFSIHHLVNHEDRPGHFWYSVTFWMRDGIVRDAVFHKHDSQPDGERAMRAMCEEGT